MKNTAIIFFSAIIFLAICSRTPYAQDLSKYEFFGGLSYADIWDSRMGWNFLGVRNINRTFGIAVDISGTNMFDRERIIFSEELNISTQRHLFLAGFQVAKRDPGKWVHYAQILAGLDHSSYSYDLKLENALTNLGSETINSFATTFGGGVDYRVKGPFALRLIHANFIIVNSAGAWDVRGKVSCGLVFLQGKQKH